MTKKHFQSRNRRDKISWYLMMLPTVLYIFIFSYIPMGGIIIAFKNFQYNKGVFGSDWVGLENFKFFFKTQDAFRVTFNTLYLNALFIICGLVAAVAFALLLFEIKKKLCIKIYQTVMILPHFLSWVVVGYMVYALLSPEYGFINGFMKIFGLEPIQWYSESKYWPAILVLSNVWKTAGMSCITYYAGLMGIDNEYFEAARLDGANKWQEMRYISMPSIKPLIIIMTVLALGNVFRADFGMFYNLTRDIGALYPTTDVIDTYIFRALRVLGNINMSAAVGVFQSIVGFITIVTANWIVKKDDPDNAVF